MSICRETLSVLSSHASKNDRDFFASGLGLLNTLDNWKGEWTAGQSNYYEKLQVSLDDYEWRGDNLFRTSFKGRRIRPVLIYKG